jgi:hypothetical protein
MAEDQNSPSKEIVLEWIYPDKGDIDVGEDLFGEVLNGILEFFGIHIEDGLEPNMFNVHFRDINAFKFIFEQNWSRLGEDSEHRPYRIQMLLDKWPDEIRIDELYKITNKYFEKLHVPYRNVNGTSMIEAVFPSQSAYLANMMEFFQLVGLKA